VKLKELIFNTTSCALVQKSTYKVAVKQQVAGYSKSLPE
jgi:hypothetical protein